eukprot:1137805-Pelagomonas_calceolata.AAC.2
MCTPGPAVPHQQPLPCALCAAHLPPRHHPPGTPRQHHIHLVRPHAAFSAASGAARVSAQCSAVQQAHTPVSGEVGLFCSPGVQEDMTFGTGLL